MEDRKTRPEEKQPYVEPRVLATYKKEDLEEAIMPCGDNGTPNQGSGCGCGGCGSI